MSQEKRLREALLLTQFWVIRIDRDSVEKEGPKKFFGDSSVTIAQWWRARHIRKLVIRKVPGSIPAENTSTQIHMDLST